MVKLVADRKEMGEEEEKLLPEQFKRWQEREPGRKTEGKQKTKSEEVQSKKSNLQ